MFNSQDQEKDHQWVCVLDDILMSFPKNKNEKIDDRERERKKSGIFDLSHFIWQCIKYYYVNDSFTHFFFKLFLFF